MMHFENDGNVDQFCLQAKREEFLFFLGLDPATVDWEFVEFEWGLWRTYLHCTVEGTNWVARQTIPLTLEDLEYARTLGVL